MEEKVYIIIEEHGAISLSQRISELIKDGYYPYGNLVVASNIGYPPLFCQAMILKNSLI